MCSIASEKLCAHCRGNVPPHWPSHFCSTVCIRAFYRQCGASSWRVEALARNLESEREAFYRKFSRRKKRRRLATHLAKGGAT